MPNSNKKQPSIPQTELNSHVPSKINSIREELAENLDASEKQIDGDLKRDGGGPPSKVTGGKSLFKTTGRREELEEQDNWLDEDEIEEDQLMERINEELKHVEVPEKNKQWRKLKQTNLLKTLSKSFLTVLLFIAFGVLLLTLIIGVHDTLVDSVTSITFFAQMQAELSFHYSAAIFVLARLSPQSLVRVDGKNAITETLSPL